MNTNDTANDEGELDEIIILPPAPSILEGEFFAYYLAVWYLMITLETLLNSSLFWHFSCNGDKKYIFS